MASRKIAFCLLIFITVVPFCLGQKVKTDLIPGYDVAALKTFSFLPVDPSDPLSARPEIAQKIRTDLKTELQKIGYQENDSNPDFLVSYSASRHDYTSTYSTGATGITSENEVWNNPYSVGTLIVDFLDGKTKKPFWRGAASETVYSGTFQKYIPKGAQKMMDAFRKDRDKLVRK